MQSCISTLRSSSARAPPGAIATSGPLSMPSCRYTMPRASTQPPSPKSPLVEDAMVRWAPVAMFHRSSRLPQVYRDWPWSAAPRMFSPRIVARGSCAGASIAKVRKRTACRMQLAILSGGVRTLRDLTELLTNDRASVPMDRAALDIARLEYPDLDPEPWIRRLDEIATEIGAMAGPGANGRAF